MSEAMGIVRLSLFLGWQDVRLMYRRTVLGQFWITLAMAVTFIAIGSVFGLIFKSSIIDYLPFLACGLVFFTLWAGILNDGSTSFIAAEPFIKQLPLPPLVYFLRVLWKAVFVLLHNAVALAVLFLFYPRPPSWTPLLAIPGLAIGVVGMGGLALALAMLSTRYRDVPQIVAAIVQVCFYLTPIVWLPTAIPEGPRELLLTWNPFYHFIEIVRAPLLSTVPSAREWLISCIFAAIFLVAGIASYRWKRRELAFWV